MMPTKSDALSSLCPGAEWVLRGDELEWLSASIPQPTEAEIKAELDHLIADHPRKVAQQARAAAFAAEADPLFFQAQAGEINPNVWKEKRDEIRLRFPYPDNNLD